MVKNDTSWYNKLLSGKAANISPYNLELIKTELTDIYDALTSEQIKKVNKCIKNKKGCRLQLTQHQGGKINWHKIGATLKKGAKAIARPLIHGTVAGLATMVAPEAGPFAAPLINYGIDKGLDKAHLGFGSKKNIVFHNDSDSESDEEQEGGNLKNFLKHKVWDKIPKVYHKPLEDLGKAAIKNAGFGVSKGDLLKVKNTMKKYLNNHLPTNQSAKVSNDIFKYGHHILDHHMYGGKLSDYVKHGVKTIYNYAKPAIKYAGEHAIKYASEYARPALEKGFEGVASSLGVDPSLAKLGADMVLNTGSEMAHKLLSKHTTHSASQTPQHVANQIHKDVLGHLQNHTMAPSSVDGHFRRHHQILNGAGLKKRIYLNHMKEPIIYGLGLEHQGTMINPTNPATQPFIQPPNLPQGLISGGSFGGNLNAMQPYIWPANTPQGLKSGGSFIGYGKKYGGSF